MTDGIVTLSQQRRAWGPALLCIVGTLLLAGCGADGTAGTPAAESSTTTPPPPTSGVLPWGADLHGFGDRSEARCLGDDAAIRMLWSHDHRFTVCRDAAGRRYLRAWTTGDHHGDFDAPKVWIGMQGAFFTDTADSVQFVADDAKIDIGAARVTIVWPKTPAENTTRTTSFETGAGWTRLD